MYCDCAMYRSVVLSLCFAAIVLLCCVKQFSVDATEVDSNMRSLSLLRISRISRGRITRQVKEDFSPEETPQESRRYGANVIPEDLTRENDTSEDFTEPTTSPVTGDIASSTAETSSHQADPASPTQPTLQVMSTTEGKPQIDPAERQTSTLPNEEGFSTSENMHDEDFTESATSPLAGDIASSTTETRSHQDPAAPTQRTVQMMSTTEGKPQVDLCKEFSRFACGPTVQCATDSDVKAVFCICEKDEIFDADSGKCLHKDSCKISPCPVGDCDDDHGKTARSCDCSDAKYMDLNPDCSVHEDVLEYCEEIGAKPVVKGTSGYCACGEYQSLSQFCTYKYCSNFKYSCKDICEGGVLGKDDRCCQGWNSKNCSVEPDETYCKPGYLLDNHTGSCIDACTWNKATDVCDNGCSTDDLSDIPFSCKCGSGESLQVDGITCKPRSECTSKQTDDCMERGGQLCEIEGTKPKCRCVDDHILISGKCVGHCTPAMEQKCTAPFATCNIVKNQEACICLHPLVWNDHESQCELLTIRYIATFQVATSQLTTYSTLSCDHEEDIEKAMFMLYGSRHLLASKAISCTDTYEVQLTFRRPVGDPVVRRILLCQYQEKDACFFPPGLRIQRGSATVHLDDMCETSLKGFAFNFPNHYSCARREDGSYALKCTDPYRTVTKAPLKNLHVDLCVGKPCNDTCTGSGKECFNEQCVCKFGHIPKDDGSCVEACDPTPCENGGVCTVKDRSTYVCSCAPEYFGPHCEHENEELHASRKQVVIISSVLGSLLVCFVFITVALVLCRIRKSRAARSELRNQSKLQQCYDGIQRESAVPQEEYTAM
ncbi:glycoprotein antigen BM86-like [Ornithodoros turicata]|uniref:glycoprotein antigen BM86-like n=1 Tax=Ornithodoros turicata TaxID=34597 RepID=UPI003138FA4F